MRLSALLGCVVLAGCLSTPSPQSLATAAARAPTEVAAPAARTWDAVIDVFAASNIPIRTMDRASGFIATDQLAVTPESQRAEKSADCGTVVGMPLFADRATYNVLVRGDSARSTVRITVRWTQGGVPSDPKLIECASTGAWEGRMEAQIKTRAESK